ncbi:MAG: hypothetical protein MN733_21680, partial [Nitrososphaera sp.]|nr:hypothetical protein [Nitrososphaera sp.]
VQPEQRRADIIGFLSGITLIGRFTLEDKLAEVQTKTEKLELDFQSVKAFLTENGVPSLIEAAARVRDAEEAVHAATELRLGIQREINEATNSQGQDQPGRLDNLRRQLLAIKEEAAQIERSFIGLQQEEKRLDELLASLRVDRQKAQRLRASSASFGVLGYELNVKLSWKRFFT